MLQLKFNKVIVDKEAPCILSSKDWPVLAESLGRES